MKYLGVDPGGRRLGLALGDDETAIVFPLGVVLYEGLQKTAAALHAAALERGALKIVVGLPTTEDGAETAACRRSRALAEALISLGSDVALQPEFLSTHEAKSRARDIGRPRDEPVDDLAASIILEDYLANSSSAAARCP